MPKDNLRREMLKKMGGLSAIPLATGLQGIAGASTENEVADKINKINDEKERERLLDAAHKSTVFRDTIRQFRKEGYNGIWNKATAKRIDVKIDDAPERGLLVPFERRGKRRRSIRSGSNQTRENKQEVTAYLGWEPKSDSAMAVKTGSSIPSSDSVSAQSLSSEKYSGSGEGEIIALNGIELSQSSNQSVQAQSVSWSNCVADNQGMIGSVDDAMDCIDGTSPGELTDAVDLILCLTGMIKAACLVGYCSNRDSGKLCDNAEYIVKSPAWLIPGFTQQLAYNTAFVWRGCGKDEATDCTSPLI